MSEQTWQQLVSRYDQRQLLELLALIGTYTLVAHILNSCGIAIDDWLTNPPLYPRHERQGHAGCHGADKDDIFGNRRIGER